MTHLKFFTIHIKKMINTIITKRDATDVATYKKIELQGEGKLSKNKNN